MTLLGSDLFSFSLDFLRVDSIDEVCVDAFEYPRDLWFLFVMAFVGFCVAPGLLSADRALSFIIRELRLVSESNESVTNASLLDFLRDLGAKLFKLLLDL